MHSGEIAGKMYVRPLFWHLWIGRARHLGPDSAGFVVEVFNVGGWLTHGDLVLDTEVDFLAVAEHRLRGWLLSGRLLLRILPMLVMLVQGVLVLRVLQSLCLSLILRSSIVFFDYGRAVRCMLPLGHGGFLHMVVLHGNQGADREAEKLALTDQLLDAALGRLHVSNPAWLLEISTWSPPRFLALQKGSRLGSGLTLKLLGLCFW